VIPDPELDTYLLTVTEATDLALGGEIADGHTYLTRPVAGAEGGVRAPSLRRLQYNPASVVGPDCGSTLTATAAEGLSLAKEARREWRRVRTLSPGCG
jgi:hypothetical protein